MKSCTEKADTGLAPNYVGRTALGPSTKLAIDMGVAWHNSISPALWIWWGYPNGSAPRIARCSGAYSLMKSIALGTESANKTPPRGPVNTVAENSTRRALISFQKCAIQSMAADAMALLVVTRNADESGPCSASINTSSAARRASAEASANTIDSLGPAGMPGSRWSTSARLAAMTHGLPGPSILSALGMVEVPKAAAATAC